MTEQYKFHNESRVIEWALLIHFGLKEIATGDAVADEAASMEEMAVPILYHYSSTQQPSSETVHHRDDERNDSFDGIVALANLAQALYTLPSNILSSNASSDSSLSSRQVNMGKSTMIFQPVEVNQLGNGNLVWVIQIPSNTMGSSANSIDKTTPQASPGSVKKPLRRRSTTPQALAKAWARQHELFVILRGGGVHTLLQQHKPEDFGIKNKSSQCLYSGMDQLYTILKQNRKLQQQIKRMTQSTQNDISDDDVASLQQRLEELQGNLTMYYRPLYQLRKALNQHFSNWIDDYWQQDGSGRCVVEYIPQPRFHQHCARIPHPDAVESTRLTLRQFFRSQGPSAPSRLNLLQFFQPKDSTLRLQSVASFGPESHLWTVSEGDIQIERHTIFLLYSYMSRVLEEMEHNQSNALSNSSTSPSKILFDHHAASKSAIVSLQGFVTPPPMSLFDADTTEVDFLEFTQDDPQTVCRVWAPRVHVPLQQPEGEEAPDSHLLKCRACLFQLYSIQLLVFLSDDEENSNDNGRMAHLNQFLHATLSTYSSPECWQQRTPWTEPGQDILYVNTSKNRVYVYNAAVEEKTKHVRNGTPRKDRFFSSSINADQQNVQGTSPGRISETMLDARHLWVCRLKSLDTLLAIEDAMLHFQKTDSSSISTYLSTSQQWMYAIQQADEQLYIVLDASLYVTVADMEAAVERIRNALFTS